MIAGKFNLEYHNSANTNDNLVSLKFLTWNTRLHRSTYNTYQYKIKYIFDSIKKIEYEINTTEKCDIYNLIEINPIIDNIYMLRHFKSNAKYAKHIFILRSINFNTQVAKPTPNDNYINDVNDIGIFIMINDSYTILNVSHIHTLFYRQNNITIVVKNFTLVIYTILINTDNIIHIFSVHLQSLRSPQNDKYRNIILNYIQQYIKTNNLDSRHVILMGDFNENIKSNDPRLGRFRDLRTFIELDTKTKAIRNSNQLQVQDFTYISQYYQTNKLDYVFVNDAFDMIKVYNKILDDADLDINNPGNNHVSDHYPLYYQLTYSGKVKSDYSTNLQLESRGITHLNNSLSYFSDADTLTISNDKTPIKGNVMKMDDDLLNYVFSKFEFSIRNPRQPTNTQSNNYMAYVYALGLFINYDLNTHDLISVDNPILDLYIYGFKNRYIDKSSKYEYIIILNNTRDVSKVTHYLLDIDDYNKITTNLSERKVLYYYIFTFTSSSTVTESLRYMDKLNTQTNHYNILYASL